MLSQLSRSTCLIASWHIQSFFVFKASKLERVGAKSGIWKHHLTLACHLNCATSKEDTFYKAQRILAVTEPALAMKALTVVAVLTLCCVFTMALSSTENSDKRVIRKEWR